MPVITLGGKSTSCFNLSSVNSLGAIGRVTEWHEGHAKFEGVRKFKVNEKKIEREIVNANVDLKTMRHKRLLELYTKENQEYEEQLNAMGFAILKDRL